MSIEVNTMHIDYSSTAFGETEVNPSITNPNRRKVLRSLRFVAAVAFMAVFAAQIGAGNSSAATSAVPANIEAPEGAVLLFELNAVGDQIYTCAAKPDDAAAFVWTFTAPDAELFNRRDEVVGTHFAGPTWKGFDGSAVVGSVLERADAPDSGAIPWLLLEAKDHAGSGVFSTITHVQRLSTVGGTAPTDGCDAAHAGEETRSPYKATYAFYYAAAPATSDPTPAS
jgi:hypothetical protein